MLGGNRAVNILLIRNKALTYQTQKRRDAIHIAALF